jgi:hypothetical protein
MEEWLVDLLWVIFGLVLPVLILGGLYAKAGYPWWIGLFALIPLAWIVLLLYLVFATWPVAAPLEEFEVCVGRGTEETIVALLMRAHRAANKGRADLAQDVCRLVADRYAETPCAKDAEVLLERLQAGGWVPPPGLGTDRT